MKNSELSSKIKPYNLSDILSVTKLTSSDFDSYMLDFEKIEFIKNSCTPLVLSNILNNCPVGVVAIDTTGKIFYCNEQYENILGIKINRVIGRLMSEVEPEALMLEVLKTQKPIHDKIVLIKTLNKTVKVNINTLFQNEELLGIISVFEDITEYHELDKELNRTKELVNLYQQELDEKRELPKSFAEIEGKHPLFSKALQMAATAAPTDAPVLILGDHGTGKEVMARAIHNASNRKDKPFIAVNCAAVPDNLLESELFGYEGGTFTGASKEGRLGKFELANGGTLFLDEIGDMPLSMQSKILRVLQEKEIEKIGRSKNIAVDVRIIAATNRKLNIISNQENFRADLYYRLNVFTIGLPPLKDRGDDIIYLANSFLDKNNSKYNKKLTFSAETIQILKKYQWPGNVRELANCIEYAVIICNANQIKIHDLPNTFHESQSKNDKRYHKELKLKEAIAEMEKEIILKAINQSNGNKSEAIRMLDISRRTFYKKIKLYNIDI